MTGLSSTAGMDYVFSTFVRKLPIRRVSVFGTRRTQGWRAEPNVSYKVVVAGLLG